LDFNIKSVPNPDKTYNWDALEEKKAINFVLSPEARLKPSFPVEAVDPAPSSEAQSKGKGKLFKQD